MSEVKNEIQVVWLEVNAFPSESKPHEILVRSRYINKINDWYIFVIHFYKASINYL